MGTQQMTPLIGNRHWKYHHNVRTSCLILETLYHRSTISPITIIVQEKSN